MQKTSSPDIDPILEYLLEFNEKHSIEYRRFLIPPGGLQAMLDSYKKFRLNRSGEPPVEVEEEVKSELDQLMDMV